MGLFKRKSKEPIPVGNAFCTLTESGEGYVAQQHHQLVTAAAISAIAPVTWALFTAYGFNSRDASGGRAWLESVLSYGDGVSLNDAVNDLGVAQFRPGELSEDLMFTAVAIGKFSLTSTSNLIGWWQLEGSFDPDEHATRILGSLLYVAEACGSGRDVWYALDMLASTDLDFASPGIFTELPQKLLDYGAQQAGLDDLNPFG